MDAKLKHLEFIQAVIARMSTNSFLFKGWAITIAAGISAFAAVDTRAGLIIIALVSTIMFWGLDGYYLWLERCFVKMHNAVAAKPSSEIDFAMSPDKQKALSRWLRTCIHFHLLLFYGSILIMDVAGIVLIRSG